ncbi:unnamed protein product [Blepharisma stoltei]|uniref:Uncharacterized protein n=1 Tax=Blepharisma stoltei TaxID=1481888 RepID=A0AAU9ILP2_9CILI|nr:unnamed protein product [Blepharisma stoltei]
MSHRSQNLIEENNRLKEEILRLKEALKKSIRNTKQSPAPRSRNHSSKLSRPQSGNRSNNTSIVKKTKKSKSSERPSYPFLQVSQHKQSSIKKQKVSDSGYDENQNDEFENSSHGSCILKDVLSDESSGLFHYKPESELSTASKKNIIQELENEYQLKEQVLLDEIETLKEENGKLKLKLNHSESVKPRKSNVSTNRCSSTPKNIGNRSCSGRSIVYEKIFTPLKGKQCKTCDHLLSIGYSTRYCPKHGHSGC